MIIKKVKKLNIKQKIFSLLKGYWWILIVLIIVLVLAIKLLGFQKEILGKNKFDLDINSISYELPVYTKICIPKLRYSCSANDCQQDKPTVFVLYDESIDKVYRCDNNPCNEYGVTKKTSGLYINLNPIIPNGSLIKISKENEYVEIVSLGLDFIINRGYCTDKTSSE